LTRILSIGKPAKHGFFCRRKDGEMKGRGEEKKGKKKPHALFIVVSLKHPCPEEPVGCQQLSVLK
jgi:hypothetical protein